MSKFITKMVAALTIGSAMVAAVPAEARPDWRGDRGDRGWNGDRGRGWDRGDRWRGDRGYRGYRGGYGGGYRSYYAPPRYYGYGYDYPRYRYYGYDRGGDALIAGIAGLAIGAAIASDGY